MVNKRGQHPNSKANLKPPFTKDSPECSPETSSENGKKGAEKANENERIRKTYKLLFLELNKTSITEDNDLSKGKLYKTIASTFPDLPLEEITQQVAHYASLHKIVLKGGKGAVAAFTAIRDTMGENPTNKVENSGTINTKTVYITPEEQKDVYDHISKVIGEKVEKK